MQSDGNSFGGDVVSDSFNKTYTKTVYHVNAVKDDISDKNYSHLIVSHPMYFRKDIKTGTHLGKSM